MLFALLVRQELTLPHQGLASNPGHPVGLPDPPPPLLLQPVPPPPPAGQLGAVPHHLDTVQQHGLVGLVDCETEALSQLSSDGGQLLLGAWAATGQTQLQIQILDSGGVDFGPCGRKGYSQNNFTFQAKVHSHEFVELAKQIQESICFFFLADPGKARGCSTKTSVIH